MDLRRLRYFVAVAEELNFSRAAVRLHISQPPLSNQIKHLEEELGVLLFDRTRRGVRLTEAGTILLEEARRIFIQVEQTTRTIERVGTGKVGRLSIGFVPSASDEVLPRILDEFRGEFPDVELFLHEMKPDRIVERLHGGRIDVGFFYLPFEDETLSFKCVSREMLVAALPDTHSMAREPVVNLADLAREPFILPMQYRMPGLYACVTEVCRRAGFTPKPVQKDVWLMQTIVGLVAGGMGVALVPASLENLTRRGVVYLPIEDSGGPTVEMGVVWRSGDDAPVLGVFLDIVEKMSHLPSASPSAS